MFKGMMFKGLFNRLMGGRRVHPILAEELAAANYPHRSVRPQKTPVVSTQQVNAITERFMDHHRSLTLADVWQQIWAMTPEQYFGGTAELDRRALSA